MCFILGRLCLISAYYYSILSIYNLLENTEMLIPRQQIAQKFQFLGRHEELAKKTSTYIVYVQNHDM